MELSIQSISDPKKLSKLQEPLDAFVTQKSKNPFVLSTLFEKRMESTLSKDSIPTFVVLKTQKKIVGVAPLLIMKCRGVRFAKFLFDYYFSPDFVFDSTYSEECLRTSLNFIFDHMGCWFATLDLPLESQNLQILERICKTKNVYIHKKNYENLNHSVITVDGPWSDFQKSRGSNFRRQMRSIERKLSSVGSWQIIQFEGIDNKKEALQRIVEIENASWKKDYHLNFRARHVFEDEELSDLWEWSSSAIRTYPDFNRKVWLLELNNHSIAYCLVFQHKETAYIYKTSYNDQYKQLYPGIYLINNAVCDLFNCGKVRTIDFMTNLPFMTRWTSKHQYRVKLLLTKGFLPSILGSTLESTAHRPEIRRAMKLLRSHSGLINFLYKI